jgi:hypothetical protein
MEGRLMLSTVIANIDFAPLNLSIIQFSLDSTGGKPGETSPVAMAVASEGGFINTQFLTLNREATSASYTPVLSYPDPDLTESSVSQLSIRDQAELKGLLDGDTSYIASVNLGPAAAVDAPVIGGFELRPSVIPVWDSSPERPSVDPTFVTVREGPVLSEEGGAIPIEPVLSDIAKLARPTLGQDVAGAAPSDDLEAAGSPPRLAATSPAEGGAISGELARAMAFELAGGEPAESQRSARTDHQGAAPTPDGSSPRAREPLSSAHGAASNVLTIHSRAIPSADDMEGRQPALIPGTVGEFASGMQRAVGHAIGPFVGPKLMVANVPMAMAPTTAAPLDRAREEAFEEFDIQELAAGPSLGLESSLRGALNATPLLMILALERIAASNSRRTNRQDEFVSAHRRPSRNSLRGGERLV